MKTIENKKISITVKVMSADNQSVVDSVQELTYSKLISECCNKASDPKAGFSYNDIKSIDRVKTALAAEKDGLIDFEDADYEFVKDKVINERWLIADMQFIEFVDYIKDLK